MRYKERIDTPKILPRVKWNKKAMSSGRVVRFEDLLTWQKAKEFIKRIYQLTRTGGFSKDLIRRASVSVMSNLAKGFERGSRAEFRQFVVNAKGSCAEVRSRLYAPLDIGYLTEKEHRELDAMACEITKNIGELLAAIKRNGV